MHGKQYLPKGWVSVTEENSEQFDGYWKSIRQECTNPRCPPWKEYPEPGRDDRNSMGNKDSWMSDPQARYQQGDTRWEPPPRFPLDAGGEKYPWEIPSRTLRFWKPRM